MPPSQEAINIDMSRYLKAREAGTAALVKLNGVVHYTAVKFDPDTGEAVPTLVPMQADAIASSVATAAKNLAEAQKYVDTFAQLAKDFDAAPEKIGLGGKPTT